MYGEVEKGRHGVSFFTSSDLKDWTFASNVPGDLFDEGKFLYECPDFFELSIQGETGTRWVLTAANRQYAVGSFDGRTFIPEATRLEQTRPVGGLNPVYAWQTFSDAPDGRRIQMAWDLDARGQLGLRVFVDRVGLEIFSCDGLQYLPLPEIVPAPAKRKLSWRAGGAKKPVRTVIERAWRLTKATE